MLMYLRLLGNLFKDFTIERKVSSLSPRGRAGSAYNPGEHLKAAIVDANPVEQERWRQLQHPITHTIIQKGTPKAEPEDRLILGDRIFFIQGVDEPGELDLWTIYYVEERFDTNGY